MVSCPPRPGCAGQDTFLSSSRKETFLEFQRKATRGSVLWTPRKSGESKGKTRVAASAVRRGRCARIPLPLNRTSDRGFTLPLPAARGNMNNKKPRHCEPVHRLVWQSAFRADNIRPYRGNPKVSSQTALRTAWRYGMDFVPDLHKVRYPRVRSHALHDVARVWRPFFLPPGALKD